MSQNIIFSDANKWSEDRLKLLFGEIKAIDGPFEFTIKELKSIKGESMASNRKNKLICYWDYELELKWQCIKKINDKSITGNFSKISEHFVEN